MNLSECFPMEICSNAFATVWMSISISLGPGPNEDPAEQADPDDDDMSKSFCLLGVDQFSGVFRFGLFGNDLV